jgi:hypothetical protein
VCVPTVSFRRGADNRRRFPFRQREIHEGDLRGQPRRVISPQCAASNNLDWATGFAGREMPRWSRRVIALGRKPSPLRTCDVMVEGDDV